jgi:hypothetical protein
MPETYLHDPLADSLLDEAAQLPEARELAAALRSAPAGPGATRIAVRGLAGSSRAYLTAWLQRATGRAILYLVPPGDAFEEARDDLEYFLGPGRLRRSPTRDPALRSGRPTPGSPRSARPRAASRRPRAAGRGAGDGARPAPARAETGSPARCCRSGRVDYDPERSWSGWCSGLRALPEVESMGHFARRGGS